MLASWRNPTGLLRNTSLNTLAPAMALLAALAVSVGVTVPQPYHHGVSADLPKIGRPISMPHAMRDDAMIVTIMRNGDVFFGNGRVWPDQLAASIRKDVDRGSEKKVYIRADARVLYVGVKEVLDAVHAAGIVDVRFFADQRRAGFSVIPTYAAGVAVNRVVRRENLKGREHHGAYKTRSGRCFGCN
jgi:biopolymer transport protein ExbD